MKKTLIVFALVLAMMVQLLPVAAFAETETVETEPAVTEPVVEETEPEVEETEPEVEETEPEVEETEPEVEETEPEVEETEPETEETEPEAEASEEESKEPETVGQKGTFSGKPAANPLYPEYTAAVQADDLYSSFDREAQDAEEVYAAYSVEQAIQYITGCMEQRKTYFTFEMYFSYQPGGEALGELLLDMWYAAMEHNGVPTQGDYLKWHWLQVDPWKDSYYYDNTNGTCRLVAIYHASYHTTAAQESQLTTRVNQILNGFGFNAATTDYEKAYTIYNWVTTNIRYDYDGLNRGDNLAHSAYKGVMQGTCVCQGYASIIYRMYLQVGIPCRVVAGDAYDKYPYIDPSETDDNHGWNIAYINGKWYNLDATWDEGVAASSWSWFLKCPNKFPDHSRWSEYNSSSFNRTYPMATSNFNPSVYNGIVQVNGYWGYYVNGFLQTNATGFVYYNNTYFYIQNGILNMNLTGLVESGGKWYYVENGAWKPGFTGLTNYNDTWFYVQNGTVDWQYTGLVPYNGNYFYVQNSVLDWAYTGLGYHDGGWYFIQNALLKLDYAGLVYFNGTWFYVQNGHLTWDYTGVVYYEGNYFYVQNNVLDWSYTGLGYHDGRWYLIQNALLKPGYYGFVEFNGSWFYIQDSQLTFQYTGLVYYSGNYLYVENSRVRWDYSGYVWYNGQYHYVENGVMRWY